MVHGPIPAQGARGNLHGHLQPAKRAKTKRLKRAREKRHTLACSKQKQNTSGCGCGRAHRHDPGFLNFVKPTYRII